MIRTGTLLGCCTAALLVAQPASADSLQQALEAAYAGNPTLSAQRAKVRVADEGVPIARSAGLPTIEGVATYQENALQGEPALGGFYSDPDRQFVSGINATVPLIAFGGVRNSVSAARLRAEASRSGLAQTEGELFSAVVAAYMNVLRDEAVVRLNRGNAEVMRFTVRETQERQNAGNRGPTDVAQAEARLALAETQAETAEARLISSREEYVRLVGQEPGALEPPPPLPPLPGTPDDAVRAAIAGNPQLAGAQAEQRAARHDVKVADAAMLPTVNAIGGISRYSYLGSLDAGTSPRNRDQGATGYVGIQLKVPFFDGGRNFAQQRQAQARQALANEQTIEVQRKVVADSRSAFATWRASARAVELAEQGVKANGRVVAGLRAETRAGFRPLLDRLNAEQELLNAQTTMIAARRDAYVAGFELLAAMGKANARDLRFDSKLLYDPMVNYGRVEHLVFQWNRDPDPVEITKGTADVPAQDAKVGESTQPPVP